MNCAVILCGGIGKRFKNSPIPKQFIEINGKPIIIHTIEKFLINININMIVIPCHVNWIDFLNSCIQKYLSNFDKKIYVVEGGSSRNESIQKGLDFINKNLSFKSNDIIITHDGVRMFVTDRIINKNIEVAKKEDGVVDTCVKSTDTIAISKDSIIINEIPNRDYYYNGQTPQSGKFKIINDLYSKKYLPDIFETTDMCRLAHDNKIKIYYVEGDYYNFKITTDFDLNLARLILKENE